MRNRDAFDDFGYLIVAEMLESKRQGVARERSANRRRAVHDDRPHAARRSIWRSLFSSAAPANDEICADGAARSYGQPA